MGLDAAGLGPPGLEVLSTGSGLPVTVAAHGLGASIAETRPLLSGVPGTRVFFSARGHGDSPLGDGPYDYAALARDLEEVADGCSATQALGVSMGAGALLSLLARLPDRFARVVLFLPAAVDRPRDDAGVRRAARLADVLDRDDAGEVRAAVLAELPEDLRDAPGAVAYARARAGHLRRSPGVQQALRSLPAASPVQDTTGLAQVSAEVLLLAQVGDALHPAQAARELAAVLPNARLVVFDQPGVVFRERARLRALVVDFLS